MKIDEMSLEERFEKYNTIMGIASLVCLALLSLVVVATLIAKFMGISWLQWLLRPIGG